MVRERVGSWEFDSYFKKKLENFFGDAAIGLLYIPLFLLFISVGWWDRHVVLPSGEDLLYGKYWSFEFRVLSVQILLIPFTISSLFQLDKNIYLSFGLYGVILLLNYGLYRILFIFVIYLIFYLLLSELQARQIFGKLNPSVKNLICSLFLLFSYPICFIEGFQAVIGIINGYFLWDLIQNRKSNIQFRLQILFILDYCNICFFVSYP